MFYLGLLLGIMIGSIFDVVFATLLKAAHNGDQMLNGEKHDEPLR